MVRVQNYEYSACAGIGAAIVYTKRDIKNPFLCTQMFVQARNEKCPQQSEKVSFSSQIHVVETKRCFTNLSNMLSQI